MTRVNTTESLSIFAGIGKVGLPFLAASMLAAPVSGSNATLVPNGIMQNLTASRAVKLYGEQTEKTGRSTARSLLRFAGTWAGNDLDRCLQEVYETRATAKF